MYGYGLSAYVLWNTGITAGELVLGKLGRIQARYTALVTQCQGYSVVVSHQPDSKSTKTLTDVELSCLLYCRLNLVAHRSKVTQGKSR